MKRIESVSGVLLSLALLLCPIGATYAYDLSSVSGNVTCTGSTLVNGQTVASGTVSLVADGAGKWTSGSSSFQITSGPAQGGTCNYTLDNGRYAVKDDGSGKSATHWSLVAASSSSACANIVWGADDLSIPNFTYSGKHSGGLLETGTCSTAQ